MDSLWKTGAFSQYDIGTFRCRDDNIFGPNCTAIYAESDDLRISDWIDVSERRTAPEWDAWFRETAANSVSYRGDSVKIILCPRDNRKDHSAILNYLPFSRESFQLIRDGLQLHRSLAVLVGRGVPTISRIPCPSANSIVYTLRTQHNMTGHMALTITYFKEQRETHAILLGCSQEDTQIVRRKLKEARETAFSPFTLIKAFLDLEMRRRFLAVDKTVSSALREPWQPPGRQGMSAEDEREHEDKDKGYIMPSIETHIGAGQLKVALKAWKIQLVKLGRYASEDFAEGIHADDMDPHEYLHQLIYEYDIKIAHCERALQLTSLTFQMQIANLTRRDGKEMRAIALLTMIFLPATFVAKTQHDTQTLMAVPTFDFDAISSIPQWSIYPVLFLPLTVVVMAVYFIWNQRLQKRDTGSPEARFIV
ncbi:hypothetical protein F5X99DRAFT_289906 [Biscogniauxia marginata]|nr:hypothetical protein F5X99DRAFT_289906 [Biscogniauxia marginata]